MEWRTLALCVLVLALTWSLHVDAIRVRRSNHVDNICSMWGNFHFRTFDGDVYQFQGTCEYNLVSDCHSPVQTFSVHVKRAQLPGNSQITRVLVTIGDLAIEITKHLVMVNSEVVHLPHYAAGVLIEQNAIYTKLFAKLGLSVMWNRDDAVMVELDSKYVNQTCGLCGDFNGIPIYDEFLSNAREIGTIEFGNKHRVHSPNDYCEDPYEEDESDLNKMDKCQVFRAECSDLLENEAWSSCTRVLSPEPYIQACMVDRCWSRPGDIEDTVPLCTTLSEYSRQCSHAGGTPPNWRKPNFCAVKCPFNMEYSENGSPCVDTCTHTDTSSLCEEHKMDGCFCPPGTVFDDISKRGCIPQEKCQCKHDQIYNPEDVLLMDDKECVCQQGKWACESLPTPVMCAVEEGSHFTTFDGKEFTFHGDCYYVLSRDCVGSTFIVLGQLIPCVAQETDTCLKSVALLLNEDKNNALIIKEDGTVRHNGEIALPYTTADLMVFRPSSFHIMLQTSFGLQMQVQLVPLMQVYITLDQSFQSKTCGLCGNFNLVLSDELKTPQGLVEGTAASFGNSWKAQYNCPDRGERLDDPCSYSIDSESYAEHWCSKLKETESPFAMCHSAVNPESYYKRCKYSTCTCQKSEDCLCAVFSSYVRACTAKGIFLKGWRDTVCDKYADHCPASQTFSYLLQGCQRTCDSLNSERQGCSTNYVPVDGCACPDGLYENEEGVCVSMDKCSCYHNGEHIKPGKSINIKNEHCVCTNGKLSCHSWRAVVTDCHAPKVFFNCSEAGPDEHGLECAKTCAHMAVDCYLAGCASGCQCPSDLLDDGRGHCVKEHECPCKHNNHFYAAGSEIPDHCNTCICKRGKWVCTDKKCPASCTIYGSGHYNTFDKQTFGFSGDCDYIAVQNKCGNKTGTFHVITENVPCGTTGTTCSKSVRIVLGRTQLDLVDGQITESELETGPPIKYTKQSVGLYLVIRSDIGLTVLWDRKTTVRIILQPQHMGEVCGLCGNYNGNGKDDFTTQGQLQVSDIMEFVNSWKVDSHCPDAKPDFDPCFKNPNRHTWAKMQCSIITGDTFKDCHTMVDPIPYYDNCVKDSCACDTGGDCECFCTAVAAYAQACNEAEVCVAWRTPEICPVFCDYYNKPNECKWHYSPCHTPCFKTCLNPNDTCSSPIPNLEGCYPVCPEDKPIFDEKNQICVDVCDECIINGTIYNPEEEIPSELPCTICICGTNGTEICSPRPGCCFYNGTEYNDYDVIYNVTDNMGMCYYAICINSTIINGSDVCTTPTPTIPTETTSVSTMEPTTPPPTPYPTTTGFTSTTAISTTTITATTTPISSTTLCPIICEWTEWFNVYDPVVGGGNDLETYENIKDAGKIICEMPEDIQCRAITNPELSFEEFVQSTGQIVQCNVSVGLVCEKKEQVHRPFKCLDYEIKVLCCFPSCDTTTPFTTTTQLTTTESTTSGTTTGTTSPPSTLSTTTQITTTEGTTSGTTAGPTPPPSTPSTTTQITTTEGTTSGTTAGPTPPPSTPSTTTQITTTEGTTSGTTAGPTTPPSTPSTTTQITTTEGTTSGTTAGPTPPPSTPSTTTQITTTEGTTSGTTAGPTPHPPTTTQITTTEGTTSGTTAGPTTPPSTPSTTTQITTTEGTTSGTTAGPTPPPSTPSTTTQITTTEGTTSGTTAGPTPPPSTTTQITTTEGTTSGTTAGPTTPPSTPSTTTQITTTEGTTSGTTAGPTPPPSTPSTTTQITTTEGTTSGTTAGPTPHPPTTTQITTTEGTTSGTTAGLTTPPSTPSTTTQITTTEGTTSGTTAGPTPPPSTTTQITTTEGTTSGTTAGPTPPPSTTTQITTTEGSTSGTTAGPTTPPSTPSTTTQITTTEGTTSGTTAGPTTPPSTPSTTTQITTTEGTTSGTTAGPTPHPPTTTQITTTEGTTSGTTAGPTPPPSTPSTTTQITTTERTTSGTTAGPTPHPPTTTQITTTEGTTSGTTAGPTPPPSTPSTTTQITTTEGTTSGTTAGPTTPPSTPSTTTQITTTEGTTSGTTAGPTPPPSTTTQITTTEGTTSGTTAGPTPPPSTTTQITTTEGTTSGTTAGPTTPPSTPSTTTQITTTEGTTSGTTAGPTTPPSTPSTTTQITTTEGTTSGTTAGPTPHPPTTTQITTTEGTTSGTTAGPTPPPSTPSTTTQITTTERTTSGTTAGPTPHPPTTTQITTTEGTTSGTTAGPTPSPSTPSTTTQITTTEGTTSGTTAGPTPPPSTTTQITTTEGTTSGTTAGPTPPPSTPSTTTQITTTEGTTSGTTAGPTPPPSTPSTTTQITTTEGTTSGTTAGPTPPPSTTTQITTTEGTTSGTTAGPTPPPSTPSTTTQITTTEGTTSGTTAGPTPHPPTTTQITTTEGTTSGTTAGPTPPPSTPSTTTQITTTEGTTSGTTTGPTPPPSTPSTTTQITTTEGTTSGTTAGPTPPPSTTTQITTTEGTTSGTTAGPTTPPSTPSTTTQITTTEGTTSGTTAGPTPPPSTPSTTTQITTTEGTTSGTTAGPTPHPPTTTQITTTEGTTSGTTAGPTPPPSTPSTTTQITTTEGTTSGTTAGPTPPPSTPSTTTQITTTEGTTSGTTTGPTPHSSTTTQITTTEGTTSGTTAGPTTPPSTPSTTTQITTTEGTTSGTTAGPTPPPSTPSTTTQITTTEGTTSGTTAGPTPPPSTPSTTTQITTTEGTTSGTTAGPTPPPSTTTQITTTEGTTSGTTAGPTPPPSTPSTTTQITTTEGTTSGTTAGPTPHPPTTTQITTTEGTTSGTTAGPTPPPSTPSTTTQITTTEGTTSGTTAGPTPPPSTPSTTTQITTTEGTTSGTTAGPTPPPSTTTQITTTEGTTSGTTAGPTTPPSTPSTTTQITTTEGTTSGTTAGPTPPPSTPSTTTQITTTEGTTSGTTAGPTPHPPTTTQITTTEGTTSGTTAGPTTPPSTPSTTTQITTTEGTTSGTTAGPTPPPSTTTEITTTEGTTSGTTAGPTPHPPTTTQITTTEGTTSGTTAGPTPPPSTPSTTTQITTTEGTTSGTTAGPTPHPPTTTQITTTEGTTSGTTAGPTTPPSAPSTTTQITTTEGTTSGTTAGPTPPPSTTTQITTTEGTTSGTTTGPTPPPSTPSTTTQITTTEGTTSGTTAGPTPPPSTPSTTTQITTTEGTTSGTTAGPTPPPSTPSTTTQITTTEGTTSGTTAGPTPPPSTPSTTTQITTTEGTTSGTTAGPTPPPSTPSTTTQITTTEGTTSGTTAGPTPPPSTPSTTTQITTTEGTTSGTTAGPTPHPPTTTQITTTEGTTSGTTAGPTPPPSTPSTTTQITTTEGTTSGTTAGPTPHPPTTTQITTTEGTTSGTTAGPTTTPSTPSTTTQITTTEGTTSGTTAGPTPPPSTPFTTTQITTTEGTTSGTTAGPTTPPSTPSTTTQITTTEGTTSGTTTGPTPHPPTTTQITTTEGTTSGTTAGPTPPPSTPSTTTQITTTEGTTSGTTAGPTPTTTLSIVTGPTTQPTIEQQVSNTTSASIVITTECFCMFNGTHYKPGDTIFDMVHIGSGVCLTMICSDICEIKNETAPCSTTSTTTTPTTTTTTVTPTTPSYDCPEWDVNTNETFEICECTWARCIEDNIIEILPYECPPLQDITCLNGKDPVKGFDDNHCCEEHVCDCFCEGWGDPHYITFDGLFYSHQGNCTYVLMEEIKPKHNLNIYIDNVNCDPRETVSCPRALIVSYNQQVITMKNDNLIGAAKLEVLMGHHVLKLPFVRNGVRVVGSGVNIILEIPQLGVVVTFGVTGFSVFLPFQHFGKNTQGHCGTCNNNQADDCMLPDGKLVSDCAVMADYWPAKDLYNPDCPVPATAPPTAAPTPKPCPPNPVCELLNTDLFKECHPHVSPDNYFKGCQFDSCHMTNPSAVCTSLQTYAFACSQFGVCLYWRNYTDLCTVECPEDKVYKACGPAEPPTCQDRTNEPTMNVTTEGCFCPDGTLLFNKDSGLCVDKCGCLDHSGQAREPGEMFQLGCQDCVCDAATLSVICKPKQCSNNNEVICNEPGFIEVNETDPSDECCTILTCRCDSNSCPSVDGKCNIGYAPVLQVPEGKCCPKLTCEPKNVCVHKNMEYEPGTSVPVVDCQECQCTWDVDPKTQLYQIRCGFVNCDENCEPGFEYVEPVGDECCGKCVQSKCILNLNGTQRLLKKGSEWTPSNHGCDRFICTYIGGQYVTTSYKIHCPPFDIDNCQPGTVQLSADGCCNVCVEKEKGCKVQTTLDYIIQDNCVSQNRLEQTHCEGDCNSYSMYSELGSSSCSCCHAARTSDRTVTLKCLNGDEVSHTYVYVEECSCGQTKCQISN